MKQNIRNSGWGPWSTRTWREFGFLWIALIITPFAFTTAMLAVTLGGGLAVTVVGLFFAGAVVLLGRVWGALFRGLGRTMLGVEVPAPAPWRWPRTGGFWAKLWSLLGDEVSWRALAFSTLSFFLSIVSFSVSITFFIGGLGSITYGYWYQYLPLERASDGTLHRGAELAPGFFIDTPPRIAGYAVIGVILLLLWSPVTRALVNPSRILMTSLLGPSKSSVRVAELQTSRSRTVEDADATLRRIERDLHDGTQARLVAVAMQLGEAKELLKGDGSVALGLVTTAHTGVKEELIELRELVRGIRPPALEAGLAVALETLAARSPLACTVDMDTDLVASPAVEAIAYFCVAELLNNAVKHSGATGAYIVVTGEDGGTGQWGIAREQVLRIKVRDDGNGGAVVVEPVGDGRRTGLAGLQERIQSVNGTWELSSPPGGPTIVTIGLPVSG